MPCRSFAFAAYETVVYTITLLDYVLHYIVSVLFLLFTEKSEVVWYPCMAVNVSVQNNGGLLPDIIRLTHCYYTRWEPD